jgi:hypothetical protein
MNPNPNQNQHVDFEGVGGRKIRPQMEAASKLLGHIPRRTTTANGRDGALNAVSALWTRNS